jgi:hypothetical protein
VVDFVGAHDHKYEHVIVVGMDKIGVSRQLNTWWVNFGIAEM